MSRSLCALALLAALGGSLLLSMPATASDPNKALSTCVGCHDITSARNTLAGPPLFGIMGNKPQTPDLPYVKWDKKSLDEWLKDPTKVKGGTSMTFGIKNDQKRAAAIQSLEALK